MSDNSASPSPAPAPIRPGNGPDSAEAERAAFGRLLALVDLAEKSGLSSFHYCEPGLALELDTADAAPVPAPAADAARTPDAPGAPPAESPLPAGHPIVSPITGTFYRSPSPTAPPYVNPGDTVVPGQTLCIVEAMKLMNEIKADRAGRVARVLPKNEEVVKQGDTLFLIES